ncbi:glycoside hydrolase family 28 protein [Calocera cornea HHB12733]|uniref:galacturonan 1,4-alpha-galacturonidase n=1 Tax=Calocera cornea HHB12733 TaxID=1353952 RepID=A0A165DD58_9BASI|nr:glycoside hydrolase family 28 protein [Calocera cornea HHB12733]
MLFSFTLLALVVLAPVSTHNSGTCTLIPHGNGRDDSQQFLNAINSPGCNVIELPQPYTYSIQQVLNTNLQNKVLNVFGTLSFSTDLAYWINNSFMTDFQNQVTAWIVTGSNWTISGGAFNAGGIDGNGQAWYTRAAGFGNQAGRPISLYVVNASDAVIKNFSVRQPQFWAFFVDQSKNITLEGIYVNATNHDPAEPVSNPANGNAGNNWVVNTDGIDTYRSDSIVIRDWTVQNGDDCVAYKGNSTNIQVYNVTCNGGQGIAFGSLGQYPDRVDYVENIYMSDITLRPSVNRLTGAVYFKAWVGVSAGGPPPNGGGGGTGLVSNVLLENFNFVDADEPLYLQSCLTYSSVNVTQYCNTSTLVFQDITVKDFTGTSSGLNNGSVVDIVCSPAAPCQNWQFLNWNVTAPGYSPVYTCTNTEDIGGIPCS